MNQKKIEFIRPNRFDDDDIVCSDYYMCLSDVKKGDTFYECDHGRNVKLFALSNPKKTKQGWICKVKSENYGEKNIYSSISTTYLNANLSKIPLIITEHEGKIGYLVE